MLLYHSNPKTASNMIITTPEELRLYATAHAIDHIEPLTGIINSSEYETLRPLLGQPLYDRLTLYYGLLRDGKTLTVPADSVGGEETPVPNSFGATADGIAAALHRQRLAQPDTYWERLLFLCQPVVAFKTIEAAIALQVLSINNAGINYATADDYQKADKDGIQIARQENLAQHHAAVNRLLEELEQWYQQAPTVPSSSAAGSESTVPDGSPSGETADDADLYEIATLWRHSRYFYLAAQMLLPSARLMQEYLDIMDSRERFIRLLPDLRFVQEELIAPAVGEDFLDLLIAYALRTEVPASTAAVGNAQPLPAPQGEWSGVGSVSSSSAAANSSLFTLHSSLLIDRLVHRLRKIAATFLESRTTVLKIDKARRIAARDEAVMLLGKLCDTIRQQQPAILQALDPSLPAATVSGASASEPVPASSPAYPFTLSPLYTAADTTAPADSVGGNGPVCCCTTATTPSSDRPQAASLLVTPPLL